MKKGKTLKVILITAAIAVAAGGAAAAISKGGIPPVRSVIPPKATAAAETTIEAETTVPFVEPVTEAVTEPAEYSVEEESSEELTEISSEESVSEDESERGRLFDRSGKLIDKLKEPRTRRAENDFSCFENCCFIGNSRTLDLRDYGLVKNVYAAVGVNVETVYTKSAPGSRNPIMSEIGKKHFSKYFLQFGENECGWSSTEVFIQRYTKVINDIKRKDPGAQIYLQSIIPVSEKASAQSEFDCTNENIAALNVIIKKIAQDENVRFIDTAKAFRNSKGCLPDDAASDGIHLNKNYCMKWLNFIADNM